VKLVDITNQIIFRVLSVFVFVIFISLDIHAQEMLTWDHLADVTFEEEYDEEMGGSWLIPIFGNTIKTYQNKQVELEGYLINLDLDFELIILSLNPYAAYFFCGMAGPETVVEIQLIDPIDKFKLDQRAVIQGELILNKTEFNHFNYILKNATIEFID